MTVALINKVSQADRQLHGLMVARQVRATFSKRISFEQKTCEWTYVHLHRSSFTPVHTHMPTCFPRAYTRDPCNKDRIPSVPEPQNCFLHVMTAIQAINSQHTASSLCTFLLVKCFSCLNHTVDKGLQTANYPGWGTLDACS